MERSLRWPWSGLGMVAIGLLGWALGVAVVTEPGTRLPPGGAARAQAQGIAQLVSGDTDEESGIFLPTDRLRERQLDQARQAVAAGGFSDASTVIDDILASDSDSFLRSDEGAATWTSVKAEAAALLDAMPAAGRDAYELQFRAKAERQLQAALESDDREAVVAVARRWFHTPAGRSAAVMTALDCLATGQPLSAQAWLERLARQEAADRFEPSLSLMRALAARDAGDRETAEAMVAEAVRRAGGARLRLGATPLEQLLEDSPLAAASTGRAVDADLSRPLLVPRFRVPLTRHPGEARLLIRQRLAARDRQRPLLPAGTPLVIDDTVVLRTPLGLLGVDRVTGKRIWLQPGRFDDDTGLASLGETGDAEGGEQAVARGYEDLTTGRLASNGRLLFAVESPAAATSAVEQQRVVRPFGMNGSRFSGNTLSAYDPAAKGALAWRLPQAPEEGEAAAVRRPPLEADSGSPWYLGPPLPVGNELYVLVEELGEIRLDVLEAGSGRRLWSQPLAELDEDRRIEQPGSRLRRLAGLSPSLDDGVLVCPTGAGGVVGIDVATRTLLWAYRYDARPQEDVVRLPNGMIIRRGGRAMAEVDVDDQRRWIESTPVMADGRVFLTPVESDALHCLDTRSGSLLWKTDRRDGLMIAGVDGPRLVVVGTEGVAAYATDDGTPAWPDRFSFAAVRNGVMPAGRGLLGNGRLLLPLDAPAVVEIDLRDGSLAGLSAGREAIPGNLVAVGGEVLAQSIDSLDAFYQVTPLREALAEADDGGAERSPGSLVATLPGGLAGYWKGRLLIDSGSPREGSEAVAAAAAEDPGRVGPSLVADAMLQAMRLDFQATASLFPAALEACSDAGTAADMLRVGIDGFLSLNDPAAAWQLWQQAAERCLAGEVVSDSADGEAGPVPDGNDPLLASTPGRWLGGRLEAVLELGAAEIDAEVAAFVREQSARAQGDGPAEMALLVDLVAAHAAASNVRQQFVEMLANPPPGQEPVSVGGQKDRQLQLELTQMLMASEPATGTVGHRPVDDPAWPVGRVNVTSTAPQGRRGEAPPLASLPINGQPGLPFPEGLRLKLDRRQPGMFLHDGFGRQLGGLLSYEGSSQTRRLGIQAVVLPGATLQPTIVGRLLLIASSSGTAAFEIDLPESDDDDVGLLQHRRLWHAGDGGGQTSLIGQPGRSRASGRLTHIGGGIPLGTAVSEPRPPSGSTPPSIRGTTVLPNGAVVLQGRTLSMRHPVSGAVLWSRSMLPSASEVLTDTSCVCVCAADGGTAEVYSMHDGRQVGQCDLPPVNAWLETSGRLVLAIKRGRLGQFTGGTVQLELIDPLTCETLSFGPFAAETRAVAAGPGKVALLEPDGRLSLLDLQAGEIDFAVVLEKMPPGFNQLSVMPWRDRLLVLAGRPETTAENQQYRQLGAISGVRTAGLWDAGQQLAPLMTGAVWAVDRGNGERLWSVPATILHHGFDPEQPADLPVLVFARRIKSPGSTRQPQLSLLCLDKRTGSEVLADDRIATDQHLFYGCEIEASPGDHTVTLTHGARDITLTFGGQAVSPRPPYQGLSRPLQPPSLSERIEELFEQALDSLPF